MDGEEAHTGIDEVYDTAHPPRLTAGALNLASSGPASICQQGYPGTREDSDFGLRTWHCHDLRI